MSNIIHDIKIKSLIRTLQNNDNKENKVLKEIIELVSEFIYNFPRIKYHKDEDTCSDFYLYTYNQLEKIFKKFRLDGKATFQTWFAIVLFNLWRNFIKKIEYKDKEVLKNTTLSLDNMTTVNRYNILNKSILDVCNREGESVYVDNTKIDNIEKIFIEMPKKVRITIKAHYFEFFTSSDIEVAVNAFQLDFMLTMRKYEILVSKTRKQYKNISDTIDDINKLEYEINTLKIKENYKQNKINNTNEYRNKIEKLNNLKIKNVEKLKSMYIKLTPKEIADFFNTNANSISNLLHRGKNYIKEYLKNN